MATERINRTWTVGPYAVEEVEGHGFREYEGACLYRGRIEGEERRDSELYPSLDHALVALVGRRWTGQRGAGGTAVGTAADWFMVMIGALDPEIVPERQDEVNDRRRAMMRAQIAERERQDLLRRAAANPVRRNLARGSDDLIG